MGIVWTIIIGFVARVIAKLLVPGKNEPSGFVLTAWLGIVGAFVASYIGQALNSYGPQDRAGLIGAVVGAGYQNRDKLAQVLKDTVDRLAHAGEVPTPRSAFTQGLGT